MSGNIIAFIAAALLGGAAYWFGLRPGKLAPDKQQWLVLFIWLTALFLLVNTYLAYSGWRSLRSLINNPPVRQYSTWESTHPDDPVVAAGIISEENHILRPGDIVAYFECGNSCYSFGEPPLRIQLRGGILRVNNRDYQEREWIYDRGLNYSYYSIARGDPVVVIGHREGEAVHAEVIFRGSYEAFTAHTRRKMTQAGVMIRLNGLAAALLIGAGIAYWEPQKTETVPEDQGSG